ncbi:MAG TPA: Holliday junction branch migration protein RuvA [Candidatus Nanopelagicales bacterium]|nr:Holliday junction branch migration protein RuvA [Candidatus Nanopelagicales bacterium]
MISFVSGAVAAVGPDTAVLEVGGVGLELVCTPATLAGLRVGEPARLAAALVVREDSLTLFGFAGDDERAVFEILQTVAGVGPRLAQAALAVHRPDDLRRAVATEDLATLTKVPGIGRKGAQRMVLELKERLGPPVGSASSPAPPTAGAGGGWAGQVHAGLVALGWSARDADTAVDAVRHQAIEAQDVPALLRAALQALDRS